MASQRRNSSKSKQDKFTVSIYASSSLDDHIKQLIAEAVNKWSVENEKELKALKTELAVVRTELSDVRKSQDFISTKYEVNSSYLVLMKS